MKNLTYTIENYEATKREIKNAPTLADEIDSIAKLAELEKIAHEEAKEEYKDFKWQKQIDELKEMIEALRNKDKHGNTTKMEGQTQTEKAKENNETDFNRGIRELLERNGWDKNAPNAESEKEKIFRKELGVNRITSYESLRATCEAIERRSNGPMGYGYTHLSVATDRKWAANIRKLL